jgi:hypothetical protein
MCSCRIEHEDLFGGTVTPTGVSRSHLCAGPADAGSTFNSWLKCAMAAHRLQGPLHASLQRA